MRASTFVKLKILAGVELAHAAQVARSKKAGEKPAAQRVTITIEPTQLEAWEIWRIHMDVEPDVARAAGFDLFRQALARACTRQGSVTEWRRPWTK